MKSVFFIGLFFCTVCAAPGQSLLNKLQGKWIAAHDTTELLTVLGDRWTYSTVPGFDSIVPVTFNMHVNEWVIDVEGPKRVVHDEVVLSNPSDTITVVIDCACGDILYLSGEPYPKGRIYRRFR